MLHLLQPAALWTLAALTLPLAIHLRRPPPRTVRLGSLRFLENVPRRPVRNLRWRELLLLVARLGLLTVLSLLLAGPQWITLPPPGPRRWALLDPTASPDPASLAQWQEKRRAGYEARRLAPGFPVTSGNFFPPTEAGNAATPDLWSLLREADAELPAGSTLVVFSPVRLGSLHGIRPALGHCKVEWVGTPDAGGEVLHEWVASANNHRVIVGRSDARSTVFSVKPRGDAAANLPAPSATSILILHDAEHGNDALYVEAAVRAAADSTGHALNLQNREITPDVENTAPADWTFWLSARPVPDSLAEHAPRIVHYVAGDPVTGEQRIVALPGNAADGMRLWKHIVAPRPGPPGIVLWSDGQGDPVLTWSRVGAAERWDVYTRFDPAWTDLPRSSAMPTWMRTLLFPETAALTDAGPVHDRRLADPTQGLASDAPAMVVPQLALADQPSTDLHWLFWTVAALLFAVERLLSLRRHASPLPVRSHLPEMAAASR